MQHFLLCGKKFFAKILRDGARRQLQFTWLKTVDGAMAAAMICAGGKPLAST